VAEIGSFFEWVFDFSDEPSLNEVNEEGEKYWLAALGGESEMLPQPNQCAVRRDEPSVSTPANAS
jgi:hypothetical protein